MHYQLKFYCLKYVDYQKQEGTRNGTLRFFINVVLLLSGCERGDDVRGGVHGFQYALQHSVCCRSAHHYALFLSQRGQYRAQLIHHAQAF